MKTQGVPNNFRETHRRVLYTINVAIFYYYVFTTKRFFKIEIVNFACSFASTSVEKKKEGFFPKTSPTTIINFIRG